MKRTILATAVAATLFGVVGTANAFNPITTTADYNVYLGGATASSSITRNVIIDSVCKVGSTPDVFQKTGDKDDWAVACVIDGATGAVDGELAVIQKRGEGGSGTGVVPVSKDGVGVAQEYMVLSAANCTLAGTDTTGTTTNTTFNNWTCATNSANNAAGTNPHVPVGGWSDIEPNKFIGINIPAGLDAFNPLDEAYLNVKPFGALIFNTPITLALRNALQTVQIDNGLLDATCDDTAADREKAVCMPSLSNTEIRSLMTGSIKKWDKFYVYDKAVLANVALKDHTLVTTEPLDQKVHICRRVNGSGTQAQMNAILLNYPCDVNVKQPANSSSPAGPNVTLNSGSGDVDACLNTKNGTGLWAIGVQSTEKNVDHSKAYRFIKIDGAAPTLQAVHDGQYFDYAEQSMQWRRTDAPSPSTANEDAILSYIADQALSPAAIADLNAKYDRNAATPPVGVEKGDWQGGWLVTPSAVNVPSANFSTSSPINSSTRAASGTPNTCQMPIASVQI